MLKLLRKQFKITNIMAVSVDGKIASHAEESTTERNKKWYGLSRRLLRLKTEVAKCDCVFVSAKSIEVETGAFRISHLKKNLQEPEWIVLRNQELFLFLILLGTKIFQRHYFKLPILELT